MMRRSAIVFTLVLSFLVGGRAVGSIWNVTTDFENSTNPNGAWSYGWVNGSNFQLYSHAVTNGTISKDWQGDVNSDGTPLIWKNFGPPAYGAGTGQVSLHPGPSGQASVARWTAPGTISSPVTVQGQFFPGDIGAMQVGIFVNGLPQNTVPLWTAVDSGAFNLSIPISAGGTIDFAVYGAYYYGTTPLDATITDQASAVPEPTSLAVFFGIGGMGLVTYVWRKATSH